MGLEKKGISQTFHNLFVKHLSIVTFSGRKRMWSYSYGNSAKQNRFNFMCSSLTVTICINIFKYFSRNYLILQGRSKQHCVEARMSLNQNIG